MLLLPIFFSNPQHYLQTSRVEFESQIKFPLQEQSLHEFNISIPDNDDGDDDDDDVDGDGDGDDDNDDDQYLHESNISIILHHFSFLLPFLY